MEEPDQVKSIIVIEDNKFFRHAVSDKLETSNKFKVIGSFSMVQNALKIMEAGEIPNVVLLDLGLPGISGLEAIPMIKSIDESIKIVILTQYDDRPRVFEAISLGASGYLLKNVSPEKIILELVEVVDGGAPLNPHIASMVLKAFSEVIPRSQKNPDKDPVVELTKREHEVLVRLNEGLMRKEIANELDLSQNTINMHVKNIYKKLQVNNVTTAIQEAIQQGLL